MNESYSSDLVDRYVEIRSQIDGSREHVERRRIRLQLLSQLHGLTDEVAVLLDLLRRIADPETRSATPAFLRPDAPIVALRDYRLELLEGFRSALNHPEADEEIKAVYARLAAPAEPGCELIDACQILGWYLQLNLFLQTQVEASRGPGLPTETLEDHVDEAVRAAMPEVAPNKTLARLKLQAGAEEGFDDRDLDRACKDVERRKKRIDVVIDANFERFRQAAEAQLRGMIRALPSDSPEGREVREMLERLSNPSAPDVRRLVKRWLTVMLVLD
jgi:hypothetical protein